jgi:hypothetical protein
MIQPSGRTPRAAALLFGALLVLAATNFPAAAQTPPAAGNPLDMQIRQLHQRLHITSAQEPEFKRFTDALRSNEETMRSLIQQRPAAIAANPVERLRFQQKLVAANAAGLQRLIGPFARLYDSFSPTQKRLANQIFSPRPAVSGPGHG